MKDMTTGLFERHEEVILLLLAALSGEHILLLGPRGSAKSELAKRLRSVFVEADYFERLLTRFS
ncbi:AAA family ATPase, partial [Marinomonas arenicola]